MTFSQSIHQVWTELADGSGGPQTLLAVQKYKLHCEKICFFAYGKRKAQISCAHLYHNKDALTSVYLLSRYGQSWLMGVGPQTSSQVWVATYSQCCLAMVG